MQVSTNKYIHINPGMQLHIYALTSISNISTLIWHCWLASAGPAAICKLRLHCLWVCNSVRSLNVLLICAWMSFPVWALVRWYLCSFKHMLFKDLCTQSHYHYTLYLMHPLSADIPCNINRFHELVILIARYSLTTKWWYFNATSVRNSFMENEITLYSGKVMITYHIQSRDYVYQRRKNIVLRATGWVMMTNESQH